MTKVEKIIGVVIVTGLGLIGIYAAVGVKMLMSIGYSIVKYQIKNATLDTLSIDLTMKICNPSFLKVDINNYSIDVFLNNKYVSTIGNDTPTEISKGQPSILIIPIQVSIKSVFGGVLSKQLIYDFAQKNYDKIVVSLQGKFSGTVMKVPVSTNINKKYSLADIQAIMDAPDDPNAPTC